MAQAELNRDIATWEDVDWLFAQPAMNVGLDIDNRVMTTIPFANTTRLTSGGRPLVEEWIRTPGIRLFVQLDVRQLTIAPMDVVFMRTKLPEQLAQAEAKLHEAERIVKSYEERVQTNRVVAEDLRRKMAEPTFGPSFREIRDTVLEWDEVVDLRVGPCWDELSRTVTPAGTMVVTFLPTLYDGHDMHNVKDKSRWAVTTPLRLILKEDGTLTSFAPPHTSFHPHINANRVCHGNITRVLGVMLRENNVTGALDILRSYAVGHMENDWMDAAYAVKAWEWWQKHVVKGEDAFRVGPWDARSCVVSKKNGGVVNIEEFFEARLADIVHVGTGTAHYGFISKAHIKAYLDHDMTTNGYCRFCGSDKTGCPCHGQTCKRSGVSDYNCWLEPEDPTFVPVPLTYRVDQQVWKYIRPMDMTAICTQINGAGDYCRKPATMVGPAHYVCDEHLPAGAAAAIAQQVQARSDIARLNGGQAVVGELRHQHEHEHTYRWGGNFKHSHHHEHPKAHAFTDEINVHENNHIAFRGAHSGTAVMRHREVY